MYLCPRARSLGFWMKAFITYSLVLFPWIFQIDGLSKSFWGKDVTGVVYFWMFSIDLSESLPKENVQVKKGMRFVSCSTVYSLAHLQPGKYFVIWKLFKIPGGRSCSAEVTAHDHACHEGAVCWEGGTTSKHWSTTVSATDGEYGAFCKLLYVSNAWSWLNQQGQPFIWRDNWTPRSCTSYRAIWWS